MKINLKMLLIGAISAVTVLCTLELDAQSPEPAATASGQPAGTQAAVPAPKPPELTARQKLMSQFDLNKNGKLEPTEREACLKHLKDERKEFIEQFDTNGGGVLDEEEPKAARAFAFQKKLEQKGAAQAAAQAAAQVGVQTPKASSTPGVPAK